MARNTKSATGSGSRENSSSGGGGGGGGDGSGGGDSGSGPALVICRNKHWRYISSFHGPWLQLPPEVLASLAHANWLAPRPRAIDPAVLDDLVAIRRAVDEATDLAVRAASGFTTTAPARNGSLHGHGHSHNPARLSRERKHRMRELATTRLSQAYRVDEIAASVATMQSASTLEDVARLVLQRDPAHVDARYVHFFHQKIPSRMLAQTTPLDALDDVVAHRPDNPAPLRTRALTRLFTHDYSAAARDLTAALHAARRPLQDTHDHGHRPRDHAHSRSDRPSSLQPQLLFHRAGVYLALAHRHVHAALDGPADPTTHPDAARLRAQARQQVRQNAKRALRDFTAFLAHLDYAPPMATHLADDVRQLAALPSSADRTLPHRNRLLASPASTTTTTTKTSLSSSSDALVPHQSSLSPSPTWPNRPLPQVFSISSLFASLPPASLPPYPPPPSPTPVSPTARALADSHESITYHPLLTDALHSLLLCHALIQTPPKEHLRHAHNAARLTRLCDGYPIFLAARSPARADWAEVLRRAGNWIGLTTTWDHLCRPPSSPAVASTQPSKPGISSTRRSVTAAETRAQKRDCQKHEAILEALADERVVDEESFQRAVHARERRFQMDEEDDKECDALASTSKPTTAVPQPPPPPKRYAQEDSREYPISTDRAEAIARWVREAPPVVVGEGARKKRTKSKGRKNGLVKSVEALNLEDGEEDVEAE